MSTGKALPGGDFYPPPALIWNNMIDAGQAWSDGRLSSNAPPPNRPRQTDTIKVKNFTEDPRARGEILKISGKAIETISEENIWLLGVDPTADCDFGILKNPALVGEVVSLQVSGCCVAKVNVTDLGHRRAYAIDDTFVLQSGDAGPIEILYATDEGETGVQDCVVRFSESPTLVVILDAALPAASHSLTGATSCLATVCQWDATEGEYIETARQVTVWNHSEVTSHEEDTFGYAKPIDAHLHFLGDCEPMASR
jgi:hypothetical protein